MTQGFIASTIQVDIPSFAEKYVDQRTATLFEIHLYNTYSNQRWGFEKEFDDFVTLEQNIRTIIPNAPELEGKSMFKVTAYDTINKRKFYLLEFLRSCLVRKDIMSNEFFKDFLELDKHSPELSFNTQTKLSEFGNLPLGIQEFIYLEKDQIIFVACSDMNFASRMDALITNVNLPWEKKSDAHISVGALFIFKTSFDANLGHSFDKVFAKSYPETTGVLSYDADSQSIHLGLDSGRIIFYKVRSDSNFTQFDSMCEFKPHKSKVTGLAYDSKTGYIYSCSSDKKFIACEINYLDSLSEVTEGTSGYTRLILDKKNERIFLGTESGSVCVYLTNNFPPTLVNTVETYTSHGIRSIWIDYRKYYIFTAAQDGVISVLEMGPPGKEKFVKEISYFGGGIQLSTIVYNSKVNEIITGDKSGRIAVWSLRKGESIYAWEAHPSGISHLYFDESTRILISSGEDNHLRTWRLPERWVNEEVQKFEENEIRNMSDTMAMLKLQKALEKPEDYNSDEDSLNGWDYFA